MEESTYNENELSTLSKKLEEVQAQENTVKAAVGEYQDQQDKITQMREQIREEIAKIDSDNKVKEKVVEEVARKKDSYTEDLLRLKEIVDQTSQTGQQIK